MPAVDDTSDAVASANTTAVVSEYLPCIGCGYDLRTLLWRATCPECGTIVERSRPPEGFRVGSALAAKHIRRGLGLLAISILVQVSADIMFTAAMRYWFQIPSAAIRLVGVRAPTYLSFSARLIEFAAIVCLLCLFGRSRLPFRRGLRLSALVLAALGLFVNTAAIVVGEAWGVSPKPAVMPLIVAAHILLLGRPISLVLVWVYLSSLVDSRTWRRLRRASRVAIVASVITFAGGVGRAAYGVASDILWGPTGASQFVGTEWRSVIWDLGRLTRWWHQHIGAACLIVMLVAVWIYIRGLDSTTTYNSEHDVRRPRPLSDGSTNP